MCSGAGSIATVAIMTIIAALATKATIAATLSSTGTIVAAYVATSISIIFNFNFLFPHPLK